MDLNVFAATGRLGTQPKMQYTSNGTAVAHFPMAVSLGKDKTMWLDVTVWGKQAENVNQYLDKGSQVSVSGYLTEDVWEDDEGRKRKKIKVIANIVGFLGSPKEKADMGGEQAKAEGSGKADIDDLLAGGFGEDDFPL